MMSFLQRNLLKRLKTNRKLIEVAPFQSNFSESDVDEPKAVDSKEKFIFDYLMNQKWQAVDQEEDYSSGEELSDKKYRKGNANVSYCCYNVFLADADFIRPLVEKEEAVKSEPVDAVAELSGQKSFEPKSYPRNPDELASMRQDAKAEARAKKRAEKKAKKELKLAQRKEETARKRNEKVENLKTKLDQLREAVGNDIELDENMFDGDFDPEMHERLMAKIEAWFLKITSLSKLDNWKLFEILYSFLKPHQGKCTV